MLTLVLQFHEVRAWNYYLGRGTSTGEQFFRRFSFWPYIEWVRGGKLFLNGHLKIIFSTWRSSSMLSANLKLKISGIFNVWLLLILKFSSILKVIIIFRFSFISIWGLFYQYFWIPHSILNLLCFLSLKIRSTIQKLQAFLWFCSGGILFC